MKEIIVVTGGTEAKMPNVHFDCPLCDTAWGADFTNSADSGYEWFWDDQKLTKIFAVSTCPVCGCQATVTFNKDYFKKAMLLKTQEDLIVPTEDQK